MARQPHDVLDLYLAPVLLALDERIGEMSALDGPELARRVALEANLPEHTRELREEALLASVAYLIDTHGWALALDRRGVRVSRGLHSVVLGTPSTFQSYLDRTSPATCPT
jgi:hypothetical protein